MNDNSEDTLQLLSYLTLHWSITIQINVGRIKFIMAALEAEWALYSFPLTGTPEADVVTSTFSSKQFVFAIGDRATEYTVHGALIAELSDPLEALVSGKMSEALNGRAIFKDMDEDTFVRFCQFAYTGDYTPPVLVHDPEVELEAAASYFAIPQDTRSPYLNYISSRPPAVPEAPGAESPLSIELAPAEEVKTAEDSFDFSLKSIQKGKKRSKSRRLRQSLDDEVYDIETVRSAISARCKVRPNSSPTEDYTPVLLGHAQLYVFADKWGITNLKILALHKLHKTLTTFTLYEARRRDIVELLRYSYSNEHTPDRGKDVDELRSLVILYAACEAESLIQCSEFLALVGKGGELAQDFVQMQMKRINWSMRRRYWLVSMFSI